MTEDFAPPPSPDGPPPAPVTRAEFRAPAPARRSRGIPRWVALSVVVGGAVIVAAVIGQVALTVRDGNLEPADPGATGRLHSAQVVSGMCLESLGDSAGVVTVVPCDEDHTAQAVTAFTFTDDEWPGDAAVSEAVLHYCAGQLAPGGPLAAAAEGREWVAWVPSRQTWQHGDRKGLCIVTADTPWTGEATGSDDSTAA